MPIGDMPDIGSPNFQAWFNIQDTETKATVMRYLAMSDASGNPVAAQGAYAPSMTDMAFDLPSMVGGIPQDVTSKGKAVPYGLGTAQKDLNYVQDLTGTGGLSNNMLSWITGPQASDPTAWTAVKKGVGDPLTFNNLNYAQALAGAGSDDYLSFLADAMLNKGMTGPAAFALLKDTVKQGKASPGLLASLPTAAPTKDQQAGTVEVPDLSAGGTEAQFNQAFDSGNLLTQANDMYKGMAGDLALQKSAGYYDPKTQQYYKGFEEQKTEQMLAADKLGLAYPTQQYNDQNYIDMMTQKSLGMDPTVYHAQDAQRAQDLQDLTAKAASAKNDWTSALSNRDALVKAWNDSFTAPSQPTVGKPFQFGAPAKPDAVPTSFTPVGQADIVGAGQGAWPFGSPVMNASMVGDLAPRALPVQRDLGTATIMGAGQGSWPMGSPVLNASVDFSKRGQVTPSKTLPGVSVNSDGTIRVLPTINGQTMPGNNINYIDRIGPAAGKDPKSTTHTMSAADLAAATADVKKKQAAMVAAKYAPVQRSALNSDEMARAQLATTMRYLANQGRTPLNDQLAARSQTLRNMIGR